MLELHERCSLAPKRVRRLLQSSNFPAQQQQQQRMKVQRQEEPKKVERRSLPGLQGLHRRCHKRAAQLRLLQAQSRLLLGEQRYTQRTQRNTRLQRLELALGEDRDTLYALAEDSMAPQRAAQPDSKSHNHSRARRSHSTVHRTQQALALGTKHRELQVQLLLQYLLQRLEQQQILQ